MNERLRKLVKESDLDVYGLGKARDRWEYVVEKFAHLVVQECIEQLETGKKCDPYTGSLFTCDHNDNIDYQIKVLKQHFELELPEKFQTHVHASDTSSERVNKTAKNEHEFECPRCGHCCREWVGLTKEEVDSWELPDCPTVFEFVQFIEAKLKEKNT
jgi:predicted RNA-binding Zn-ribbon protein involved in translation (DUF1610 family)